jgi:hypothetical protein
MNLGAYKNSNFIRMNPPTFLSRKFKVIETSQGVLDQGSMTKMRRLLK